MRQCRVIDAIQDRCDAVNAVVFQMSSRNLPSC
jgi:hypothetical protein